MFEHNRYPHASGGVGRLAWVRVVERLCGAEGLYPGGEDRARLARSPVPHDLSRFAQQLVGIESGAQERVIGQRLLVAELVGERTGEVGDLFPAPAVGLDASRRFLVSGMIRFEGVIDVLNVFVYFFSCFFL